MLTHCNVQDSQFDWAHPDEISVAHHKTLVHEEHLTKVLQVSVVGLPGKALTDERLAGETWRVGSESREEHFS